MHDPCRIRVNLHDPCTVQNKAARPVQGQCILARPVRSWENVGSDQLCTTRAEKGRTCTTRVEHSDVGFFNSTRRLRFLPDSSEIWSREPFYHPWLVPILKHNLKYPKSAEVKRSQQFPLKWVNDMVNYSNAMQKCEINMLNRCILCTYQQVKQ